LGEAGAVGAAAHAVTRALGYPDPDGDGAHRQVVVERAHAFHVEVEIPIDVRRAPRPGPVTAGHAHGGPGGRGRPALLRELLRLNPELSAEQIEEPHVVREGTWAALRFTLRSTPAGASHRVVFRPGLGTSSGCRWTSAGEERRLTWAERSLVTEFPPGSCLIAEGHSGGTYPCHGLFVCFAPEVAADHVVSGPDDYRRLSWDVQTGWSRFLFGE
jgi:hypothetical protein